MISHIREHALVKSDFGGSYCLHCNSRTGLGFYSIVTCELRFNEKGFKSYLDFRNISFRDGQYFKRFSDIEYSREELVQSFLECCNKEESEAIINQELTLTMNAI
jgi:hypothetical protein